MPKETDFQELLDLVATYWIDMASSFPLLSYCSVRKGNVFVMNCGEWKYTPKTFIRQICGVVYPWFVIDDLEVLKGAVALQIYLRVLKLTAYRIWLNYYSGPISDIIIDKINALMGRSSAAPVFVTFLAEDGVLIDDVVREIHNVFPFINVIVCTGTEPGASWSLSDSKFKTLTEDINLENEREEFFKYCDALTNLSK